MRRSLGLSLAALGALLAAGCSSPYSAPQMQPPSRASAGSPSVATAPYRAPAPRGAAPAAGYAATATESAIPWDARDLGLDQAVAAGRAAGKPVAVYLLASWCGYCRKLEATTLTDAAVQAEMRAFYNVRVDPDSATGRPLAARFAQGFPTTVVLDASGTMRARIVGYEAPARFAADLRAAR